MKWLCATLIAGVMLVAIPAEAAHHHRHRVCHWHHHHRVCHWV